MPTPPDGWFDRPANVTRIYRGLWVACAVLLGIDLLVRRHEDFMFAEWFGFYAFFGFIACVALVLTAKRLRRLLMRPEDYYDR